MLKHKYIDKICIGAATAALVIVVLFSVWGNEAGVKRASAEPGYVERLFDDDTVHRVDLQLKDWEGFLRTATDEEYVQCKVYIDGEEYENIGLRAKGNNSLNLISKYGLDRYSLKLEFDHYADGRTYHGLDKLTLDSSFQDNSYMKNYIAYDMMDSMGVPAPLTSYAWVTVNGEDWGLFLAVEEPEEAFARRVYGRDHGMLYKPDYKRLEDENADVALRYTGDSFDDYDNIFRNARFDVSDRDKARLIRSIKKLSAGEDLENVVNVEEVVSYFAVQSFVVNLDSYLGPTGHNYFLYEENGRLSMLPWDYNLAFATYSLGMPEPINDAELYINYPIDTPYSGDVMLNRPMFHNIMLVDEYFEAYHERYAHFIDAYFESGYFEDKIEEVSDMIAPYVKRDPTAFCTYEEHIKGVETIREFCLLRAESVSRQLAGDIPSNLNGQSRDRSGFVDGSGVWLPDMGEISDLVN